MKDTCKINGNLVDLQEVKRAILLDKRITDAEVGCHDNALTASIAIDANGDFEDRVLALKTSLKSIISGFKIPKIVTRM